MNSPIGSARRGGGVVDHHVDAPELRHGALDEPIEVGDLAGVHAEPERSAAPGLQRGDGLIDRGLLAAGDHHSGTGVDESFGDRPSRCPENRR